MELTNDGWRVVMRDDQVQAFTETGGDAASASASASASTSASANTKHVKIVISSNKPADVSISDDSLNWMVNEETVGTKTYERDIRENSGLSVMAVAEAYNAQTTIQVYENGSLVAQDSDSHGNAIVTY